MPITKLVDERTKTVTVVNNWETVDEDGVVQHHQAEYNATYHGKKYCRVFLKAAVEVFAKLSKTEINSLFFMLDKMEHATNIAHVRYRDFEQRFDISNKSVNAVMQKLQEVDAVRVYHRGQWMINPNIATASYDYKIPGLLEMYMSLPSYEYKQSIKKGAKQNVIRQDSECLTEGCGDNSGSVYSEPYEPEDEALY